MMISQARRVMAILTEIDHDDPENATGVKGSIQTAMAILSTIIPDDEDHTLFCPDGTCEACALETMTRAHACGCCGDNGDGLSICADCYDAKDGAA